MAPTPWDRLGLSIDGWCALPWPQRSGYIAGLHLGCTYSRTEPSFPCSAPGLSPNRVEGMPGTGHRTNCSTKTAVTLIASTPRLGWTSIDYGDLQIYDAARPNSPISAVIRRGAGKAVDEWVPGHWHLVQTWTAIPTHGHAYFVLALADGNLLVDEATDRDDGRPVVRMTLETPEVFKRRYTPRTANDRAAIYRAVLTV